jgi:hypothetical protein
MTKVTMLLTVLALTMMTIRHRGDRVNQERWMGLRLSRALHGHGRARHPLFRRQRALAPAAFFSTVRLD